MPKTSTFLFHLEPDLLEALTEIAHETHTSKGNFIRQSIRRNLDIAKNVELPLLRSYHQKRIFPTTPNRFDQECE